VERIKIGRRQKLEKNWTDEPYERCPHEIEFARPEAIRTKNRFKKKKQRHREGDTQIHLQLQHLEFFSFPFHFGENSREKKAHFELSVL
jgi:hypothetical protein